MEKIISAMCLSSPKINAPRTNIAQDVAADLSMNNPERIAAMGNTTINHIELAYKPYNVAIAAIPPAPNPIKSMKPNPLCPLIHNPNSMRAGGL